ncbi:type I restriction-modification system subunit M [Methanosphaerula palustris]|uniref:site-specific DNA-methyltransferase (adenine-specific) n=1 Tax=Methanosphaerula palustris (strain ATCC BAA-1556 / DSM 19958 / E1-9c) TaxID=521011 RepID=B8GH38_METPE|nr:type I restriction-modification system subunit M [Methanosphaerula palustris]ACL16443.1 N-6 DNA methylase [Methanosphaerula palustris E1-9c]
MAQSQLNTKLDITVLESWLWEAACKIRGEIDAPKYKDYILPLIFLKRLSDVFDDEAKKMERTYGNRDLVEKILAEDHQLVRFYLPPESRWDAIAQKSTGLGELLTDAMRSIARENPKLQGSIDIVDFNATAAGQRIIPDDSLRTLIGVMGKYRLGLADVEPDIIGHAYEYLLRKFAEGSGQSAGEFYTPREVALLMARILDPKPGEEVYDPCCGSGGLLIKCAMYFRERYHNDPEVAPLQFCGQENQHSTFAMAKMNTFIHDMEAQIALQDTMRFPQFLNRDGSLRLFDIVTANPMWNQDFEQKIYETDTYNRFTIGYPPSSSADWGWIQHMFASLKKNGRMAVVLDTGAVSRGSGNTGKNRERDIRKNFAEHDLVEAVILLPENLFYNTTAPGIILVINQGKLHKGEILLVNASKLFQKGRPKNFIPDECIAQVAGIFRDWKAVDEISTIVSAIDIAKNDFNLSPSRYVAQNGKDETLPLEDAVVLLREAEEERQEADEQLKEVLAGLGLKK